MTELATIERNDVEVTPTSWTPTGEMSFEDWCEAGTKLGQIAEAVQWWIGDWINFGATTYGEKYADALEATGYEYGSLANMASVAGEFESSRRRENLSWSHHAAVASLEPAAQESELDRAVAEGLSSKALRPSTNGGTARRDPALTSSLTFEQTFPNKALQRGTVEKLRQAATDLGFTEKS
jgi:hypothetical protein